MKQSHITTALLITGGPRRVTAMLATRINARILRDACLSTLLISTYTHSDWFNAGCQLYHGLKRNVYTHNHKHRVLEKKTKKQRSIAMLQVNAKRNKEKEKDSLSSLFNYIHFNLSFSGL